MHDRAGYRGGERHDGAERQQHRPDGVERDLGDGRAREREPHPQESDDGREPGQGHHAEVRDHADRRELVEVGESDRQHRELSSQAHAEGAAHEPARQRGRDDPGRRRERELEAGVEEVAGTQGEDEQRGQRQAVGDRGLALEQERREHEDGHDHGAEDRRLGPDDRREAADEADRDHGRRAAVEAQELAEREHRGREQRHVEPGDREHVIDAGPAEAVVELGREARALAEEQAGEQRGRRGRQRARQRRERAGANPRGPRRLWGLERHEALGARRARDVDAVAREVRRVVEAVGVVKAGRRKEPQLGGDPLA